MGALFEELDLVETLSSQLHFRVLGGLGFRVKGFIGLTVEGVGVWGLGFRVWGREQDFEFVVEHLFRLQMSRPGSRMSRARVVVLR